ncbi:hypothetical protein AgCh_024354 [Apium graveolens]
MSYRKCFEDAGNFELTLETNSSKLSAAAETSNSGVSGTDDLSTSVNSHNHIDVGDVRLAPKMKGSFSELQCRRTLRKAAAVVVAVCNSNTKHTLTLLKRDK